MQRLNRATTWSKSGYLSESRAESGIYWFVLMPEGVLTRIYNVVTACAVLYVGFSIFLTIGFTQYLPPYSVYVFEKVLDGWFWLDLGLNFITAFYHDGKIVTHPGEIVMHYVRTWFFVDLFGNLPLEEMTLPGSEREQGKVLKVLKFLKIPRLLRLARLRRILQGHGKYVTLIVYLSLVCLGVHAAGCLWMLLLDPCGSFPPAATSSEQHWRYMEDIDVARVILDPALGPECVPGRIGALYAMALSYGTSMVLGFGGLDINTVDGGHYRTREMTGGGTLGNTVAEEEAGMNLTMRDVINVSAFSPNIFSSNFFVDIWILSTLVRIIGFIGVSFLTGLILKLELNAGYRETVFRRHVDAVEADLHALGAAIPEPLLRRVKEHIAERWHSGTFGRSELLSSDLFSQQLKGEISVAVNKEVLMKISFFRSASFEAVQAICSAAEDRKFLPGELIFRKGEVCSGLYLIKSGTVMLSPLSCSWTNMHREIEGGSLLVEPRNDGTRPMRASLFRLKRRFRTVRHSLRGGAKTSSRNNPNQQNFPVTSGSWFGECEVLRELVYGMGDLRRTTAAEASNVVHVMFVPKNIMVKILIENRVILRDLLVAHQKRFMSEDLPAELRHAFRNSEEWESRVAQLIKEIATA